MAVIDEVLLQPFPTVFALGGYQVFGVSHNGHYRVEGNINLLVNGKTEFFIDKIEYYSKGVVAREPDSIGAN